MALEALSAWMAANPYLSMVIISIIVTFFSLFITKVFTNQQKMKELKAKQKECQKKVKETKDAKSIMEIQKEMMACSAEMMKMSFKPMLITFIPFIIIFAFLRNVYIGSAIEKTWIWYYIGFSIFFSLILRKVLKVE